MQPLKQPEADGAQLLVGKESIQHNPSPPSKELEQTQGVPHMNYDNLDHPIITLQKLFLRSQGDGTQCMYQLSRLNPKKLSLTEEVLEMFEVGLGLHAQLAKILKYLCEFLCLKTRGSALSNNDKSQVMEHLAREIKVSP